MNLYTLRNCCVNCTHISNELTKHCCRCGSNNVQKRVCRAYIKVTKTKWYKMNKEQVVWRFASDD